MRVALVEAGPVTGPHLGPGWCLQLPNDPNRWTDGPDARLLLASGPRRVGRRLELHLDPACWAGSTVSAVDVSVNGRVVGTCHQGTARYSFPIPPQVRPGLVDVSLRARYPLLFTDMGPGMHFFRLGLPVRSIAIAHSAPS